MAVEEPELDELYREVILDHYRNPRNRGRIGQPSASAEGFNPLCGDEVILDLQIDGNVVADVRFQGNGCSISQASASMMAEAITGLSLDDTKKLIQSFKAMILGGDNYDLELLGDLEALEGVSRFPIRIKCATLCWNTLQEALANLRSPKS